MTIWEQVEAALAPLGLPMQAVVYNVANEADRPDQYLVYLVVDAPPVQHADNLERHRLYQVQVSYYDRDGLAGMPDIPAAMVAAGFTAGSHRGLPYSQQTRHYGYALDFGFLE